jgi:hypothetical protein
MVGALGMVMGLAQYGDGGKKFSQIASVFSWEKLCHSHEGGNPATAPRPTQFCCNFATVVAKKHRSGRVGCCGLGVGGHDGTMSFCMMRQYSLLGIMQAAFLSNIE